MFTYSKDPEAVLDYAFDWSPWLADAETISSHEVTVPVGITLASSSVSAGVVIAWLSGGSVGVSYRIECKVTTSAGRTDERSIAVLIEER